MKLRQIHVEPLSTVLLIALCLLVSTDNEPNIVKPRKAVGIAIIIITKSIVDIPRETQTVSTTRKYK